jgi:hypothetical protein
MGFQNCYDKIISQLACEIGNFQKNSLLHLIWEYLIFVISHISPQQKLLTLLNQEKCEYQKFVDTRHERLVINNVSSSQR